MCGGKAVRRIRALLRAALAVAAALLCPASPLRAMELTGSYVGSFQRTEGPFEETVTQHRYDVSTMSGTSAGVDMWLRASLLFQARPGESDTELFRSRFYGDARKNNLWRLTGQFAPWQETAVGRNAARERVVQLGLDLTPRNVPRVRLELNRRDRRLATGLSFSDDKRVAVSFAPDETQVGASYRRIATEFEGIIGGASLTEEWRGNLARGFHGRTLSAQVNYDALYNTYESGARVTAYYAQRGDVGLTFRPHRRWSFGSSALVRWGRSEDNNQPADRRIDDRDLSARAEYRPIDGMSLVAAREYRQTVSADRDVISDYARLQAMFRRALTGQVLFQTGYLKTIDLATETGSLPANTAYAFVDGPLRRGLDARAELRFARSASEMGETGDQWRRLLQVRARPVDDMQLDVTYRRDTLPRIQGSDQVDESWESILGYQFEYGLDVVTAWRLLEGYGRFPRQERFGSLTASWRTRASTVVSIYWSRRVSQVVSSRSDETVWGADLGFHAPGEIRTRLTWRRQDNLLSEATSTYGLTVDKSF